MPKLTTTEFVSRAKQIHGDKIDFSMVKYKNNKTKVNLKCDICGYEWNVCPCSILKGHGCSKCAIRKQAERQRKTKEDFIKRAQELHGKDRYDYSLIEYKTNFIKVKIICLRCGMCFEQTPSNHLQGNGCPYCARNRKLTTDQFIKKAQRIHGDKIDFSKVKYVNSQTKVLLRCNVCGYEWWAISNNAPPLWVEYFTVVYLCCCESNFHFTSPFFESFTNFINSSAKALARFSSSATKSNP